MANLFVPSSLEELFSLLSGAGGGAHVVAGGTDWTVRHGRALSDDVRLIDLSGVRALKGILSLPGEIVVGSMETMGSVAENANLRRCAACLSEAAASVGSWQIRNRATLGGNLANASPAADTPVALAALDTVVVIGSPRGARKISVPEILSKPNANTLEPDEIITAFHIPVKSGRVSAFGKIGSRREVSIARLNLAVSILRSGDRWEDARVFVGTLGSAALRCSEAERVLEGAGLPEAFCEALAAFVDHSIPGRSSRPYKRSAMQALGEDVLAALAAREVCS